MRFADLDGALLDVFQAVTQITDEADHTLPTTTQIHALLDKALRPGDNLGRVHSDPAHATSATTGG